MFLTKLWQNYKQMLPVYYIRQGIDTVCECFEIMAITSELHLDKWIMASLPYHPGNNQGKKLPLSKRRFEKIIRHSKGWVTVSYRLTSFRLSVLKSFELVKQQAQSLCLLEHYSISMSSSPQLRSAGRLKREERVSAGGLGGLRAAGDGHGVIDSEDAVCCFRCLWIESLCFRQKGSSGGRHNTSSMQEWLLEEKNNNNNDTINETWSVSRVMYNVKHSRDTVRRTYTDWATVCGRMSLIPRWRPSFKLSEITSTGRLGADSTSKPSSSSSSSSVILKHMKKNETFLCHYNQ